jgi:dTDP-glucose 4,6-dehydratase
MKKILVTGTLGFIGANFVRYVNSHYDNYSLIGLDKAVYDYCLLNTCSNSNYKFYLADIANEHIIDRVFAIEKPDFVINFAAESFVCSSIENPNPFIYSNVMGTQTLINASVKWGIEKFVQINTDEVYGHHTSKEGIPWTELTPPSPRNPYAASKFAAESILHAAYQTHKLNYNISRCCNVFGPRQPTNRNLIPKSIKNIFNHESMPIYGDGSNLREYIYVDDKIKAIMTILEKGQNNEIYNIGTGEEFSNKEIVYKIGEILNIAPKIDFVDKRKGDDWRYAVDCSKLMKLGWKPQYNFNNKLEETIKWYIDNKDVWF